MDLNSKSQNPIEILGMQENEDVINSSAKRQKICEEVLIEEMKDKISSLPNEILCHILSFLPTKYAVGTCILSTRWKYLWTSLPNLDFDDELLLHREWHASEMTLSFTSFVHRVLTLVNMPYIQRFYLKCGQNYKYSYVNGWICAALQHNVQELDLYISMDDSRVLPHGLFTCGTLVSLKLDAKLVLYVPSSISLPKLKTLLLKKIIFLDDDSAHTLFSSCPVLEELFVLESKNITVFNITCLSLKRLVLFHCVYTDGDDHEVFIDAPMLEYLQLSIALVGSSSMINIESLVEAYLHIDEAHDRYNIFELIRTFSHVKVLHLYGKAIQDFLLFSHQGLPMLPKVTRLEVGVKIAWQLLPDLFQNSPNLEAIFFHKGLDHRAAGKFWWFPPKQVPYCLSHSLKTIKIWNFRGLEEERKLINYFTKNSKVLNQMHFNPPKIEDLTDNKKELFMFPVRCPYCQIIFS